MNTRRGLSVAGEAADLRPRRRTASNGGSKGPERARAVSRDEILAVVDEQFTEIRKRLDTQIVRAAQLQQELDAVRRETTELRRDTVELQRQLADVQALIRQSVDVPA
jgi:hypothetical protein